MEKEHQPLAVVPQHVAIIMDGNGRWAKAHGLPRVAGHRAGMENIRRVLRACTDFGVKVLTIYAFSTENWARPPDEVQALMRLLDEAVGRESKRLHKEGVQIRHSGSLDRLPANLVKKIQNAIALTKDNDRLILNIAINYGGRAEIVEAIRRIISEGIPAEEVTEEVVSAHLYTAGLPDPDLVIRTAGEMRLSNFLIWQSAYAEYYSTPVYWPDFDEEELYKALLAYGQRERRYGRVLEK